MARLRNDESGFSLTELLVAMVVGSIVLTALMTIFIRGLEASATVNDRVEAAARGRLAMDRAVTLLNSQTCLVSANGTTSPPMVNGQAGRVAFYANLGQVDSDPWKYQLRYDAASKSLVEDQYKPTKDAGGNLVFPATPTKTRTLATSIVPTATGAPIFQYWEFDTTDGPSLGRIDDTPLGDTSGTLRSNELSDAVRVTVAFSAMPERTGADDDPRSTEIHGTATVGSANPGDPGKGVDC